MIAIELTFVQLLPYKFGNVTYHYPNKYTLIQSAPLEIQQFTFDLESSRIIETLEFPGFPGALITQGAYVGNIEDMLMNQIAVQDYTVTYSLNADDLGLFAFSNYFPEELGCDNYGKGFCAFIAEPSPNPDAEIIPKVFTLIIDNSGSMLGSKIDQAKNAAKFIVQHMNEGDKFNIVVFNSTVSTMEGNHVVYSPSTESQALTYINNIYAGGSTNISGAFGTAIPQFSDDNDNTYNIIIFLTDGVATAGITGTPQILSYVQAQIAQYEVNISIFCFGIGNDVEKPLLTQLSNNNKGIATFLENNALQSAISDFYLTVRNPVLLNTSMSFSPDLVQETYPQPLPNLFKGIQMLVVGRYVEPAVVQVDFNGEAFGAAVNYQYDLDLTATDSAKYHFLPKLWAKQKAEHLLQQYYAATSQVVADGIQEEIIALSLCYGVLTPFTSFEDNSGGSSAVEEFDRYAYTAGENPLQVLSISPLPADQPVRIRFAVRSDLPAADVQIRIVDIRGVTVNSWTMRNPGIGEHETIWNLQDSAGKRAASGVYWIQLQSGSAHTAAKLILK
ncbi:MAG: VWA domain-containing protein [Lewinellaceae bacterium]|nr:VWA domain-containing protein [Lewinellaceae bacterium]